MKLNELLTSLRNVTNWSIMANSRNLKYCSQNTVKSIKIKWTFSNKVQSSKSQTFRWIEKLWQVLDVLAIMDQSACCYAWQHQKDIYCTVLYVSRELNESFWKIVLTHKSNRLRMRRSNPIVIHCFVSLDLCILQKPGSGHSSQFVRSI